MMGQKWCIVQHNRTPVPTYNQCKQKERLALDETRVALYVSMDLFRSKVFPSSSNDM